MIEQMFGFEGSLFATNLILFPRFYPAAKTILTSARWALKIKNYTHKI